MRPLSSSTGSAGRVPPLRRLQFHCRPSGSWGRARYPLRHKMRPSTAAAPSYPPRQEFNRCRPMAHWYRCPLPNRARPARDRLTVGRCYQHGDEKLAAYAKSVGASVDELARWLAKISLALKLKPFAIECFRYLCDLRKADSLSRAEASASECLTDGRTHRLRRPKSACGPAAACCQKSTDYRMVRMRGKCATTTRIENECCLRRHHARGIGSRPRGRRSAAETTSLTHTVRTQSRAGFPVQCTRLSRFASLFAQPDFRG
jgi:hypothetical protein